MSCLRTLFASARAVLGIHAHAHEEEEEEQATRFNLDRSDFDRTAGSTMGNSGEEGEMQDTERECQIVFSLGTKHDSICFPRAGKSGVGWRGRPDAPPPVRVGQGTNAGTEAGENELWSASAVSEAWQVGTWQPLFCGCEMN